LLDCETRHSAYANHTGIYSTEQCGGFGLFAQGNT